LRSSQMMSNTLGLSPAWTTLPKGRRIERSKRTGFMVSLLWN